MLLPENVCICLHEIENNLPRTKFCFMACLSQSKILREREKRKKQEEEKSNKDKKES